MSAVQSFATRETVIRIRGVEQLPANVILRIEPLEDTASANKHAVLIQPMSARLLHDAAEFVIDCDDRQLDGLQAGEPVLIMISDTAIRHKTHWPRLSQHRSGGRANPRRGVPGDRTVALARAAAMTHRQSPDRDGGPLATQDAVLTARLATGLQIDPPAPRTTEAASRKTPVRLIGGAFVVALLLATVWVALDARQDALKGATPVTTAQSGSR